MTELHQEDAFTKCQRTDWLQLPISVKSWFAASAAQCFGLGLLLPPIAKVTQQNISRTQHPVDARGQMQYAFGTLTCLYSSG
jgi:hypothetical protein